MPTPPKPTQLHVLQGTGRKVRLAKRKGEITVDPKIPDCPSFLSGEALAEWQRVTTLSQYAKCITPAHRGMLTGICMMWAEIVDYQSRGEKVPATLWLAFGNYSAKFGMSPADNSKVTVTSEEKPRNKFAAL